MRIWQVIGFAAAVSLAGATDARVFHLDYTTSVDATSGPAVTVAALVTTDDGGFYGAPGYQVTAIGGTRGAAAISFDPAAIDDEIYYPGDPSGHFVDGFGVDFIAGGVTYTLYRGPGDFAYHEFDGSTGRLVFDRQITLTAVPEPATWAMLVVGFGALGLGLRRRAPVPA